MPKHTAAAKAMAAMNSLAPSCDVVAGDIQRFWREGCPLVRAKRGSAITLVWRFRFNNLREEPWLPPIPRPGHFVLLPGRGFLTDCPCCPGDGFAILLISLIHAFRPPTCRNTSATPPKLVLQAKSGLPGDFGN